MRCCLYNVTAYSWLKLHHTLPIPIFHTCISINDAVRIPEVILQPDYTIGTILLQGNPLLLFKENQHYNSSVEIACAHTRRQPHKHT